MTQAETKLANLVNAHKISYTGHAVGNDRESIFIAARPGKLLVLVESDEHGYPQVDEQWEAIRFADKSLMIVTHVRGRRETDFWKAINNLDGFQIWHSYDAA